ncbi:MAG TPA: pyridoxal phosphate-dependent aminotransferase, partial [Thermoanaerobaculia bacterium]|nr:pyridoxal phosphate-dependent aminotransferase [Thermoanaerobaculia bacterium]
MNLPSSIDPEVEPELQRVPALSRRALAMPASPIRKLAPLADAAKARGTRVLHLNIGQPDLETPACILDRLRQIETRILEYSPSTGTPEFLRSLQRYYERRLGLELATNQILATTGGSEAILFSMLAVANEGDDILVVEPFYANYRAFATMAGVNLVPVASRGSDGFHLPPPALLESAVTPRTRAILICNPNNPTGTVYTREELAGVADLCRARGLFLISDEVYREFVYDGREAISALVLRGVEDRVIVVDSLSKRYSACGIRLGALVTRSAEVYDACLRMAQGRLSPPGVAQFIAVGAESLGDEYMRGVVEEYHARRD